MESNFTKASGLANVGIFIVTCLSTGFLIWKETRPQAANAVATPTGSSVNYWLIILVAAVLVAACLNVVAALIARGKKQGPTGDGNSLDQRVYMTTGERQSLLDERKAANEKYLEIKTAHEPCERNIRNLESNVQRLRERDETWGVQVSARDGQIEQLQKGLKEREWLDAIAARQREAMQLYVGIDGMITDDGLTGESLFIDFRFTLQSMSVYTLSVAGVGGTIRFGNRRLGTAVPNVYPPRIASNEDAQNFEISEIGYVTVTQPLTREDAVFILNQSNHFMFDGLFIEVKTAPVIEEGVRLSPNDQISNKELKEKYPKLDIQFETAIHYSIVDRHNPEWERTGYGIRLDLTIENKRLSNIEIEQIQLSVICGDLRSRLQFLPDTDEICEQKFIDESGTTQSMGKRFKNLAASRLLILGKGKVFGSLHFSTEKIKIGQLEGSTASLILTDKYGEHHVGNHDLKSKK